MDPVVIPKPKLTRIPGELPTMRAERAVEDLSKMTKPQLFEMRDRQMKLLENKQRILKLPDKGARIQGLYQRILKELDRHDEVQNAAELFSELNIVSTGHQKLTTLEWTGKLQNDRLEAVLDSDDDEDEVDPLKIIAQHNTADKVVKYVKPLKSIITEEDIKEIESFKNRSVSSETSSKISSDLEPHTLYVMEKSVDHLPATEKFKPYKTTKSNVHDPHKETERKLGKNWENTAATPPLIVHPGTKMLSLQESVDLQSDYLLRLKKMQEDQAQKRLERMTAKHGIVLPDEATRRISQFFGKYREIETESDSEIDSAHHERRIYSDEEVVDDVEDRGFVSFSVSS